MSCNLINFKLNSFSTGASASYDLVDSQNRYIFVGMSASELSAGLTFSMSNTEKRMRLTGFSSGATVSSCSYVTSNLLIYYDAFLTQSYPGSGTTITNLAGSSYNGTLVNGASFVSTKPFYFQQNDNNDYVETADALDFRQDNTVEIVIFKAKFGGFYFSTGETRATNKYVAAFSGNPATPETYYHAIENNDAQFTISSAQVNYNKWTHLVFTYRHSSPFTKQFFIHGQQVTANAGGTYQQYIGLPRKFSIGASLVNNVLEFNDVTGLAGKFSIFRFYNKVLTQAEVTQNYNSLRGRFGSLLA